MRIILIALLLSATAFAQSYSSGLPLPGLPKSVGRKTMAGSTSVTLASDQPSLNITGSVTATVTAVVVKETRFHDASIVTINSSAGAWVNLGGSTPLANNISKFSISANIAQPTEIGVGPSAGSVSRILLANQGEGPSNFGVNLLIGNILWIKSLTNTAVSSGYITVNLGN